MNLNTYNKQNHFENGYKISDSDYDQILDRYDPDTNGNGIYNIYEVDKEKIASFVESISLNRYMVTTQKDIKYSFGAFNSYRLISQAYFEQNLAIEPILKEYTKTKYNIQKYIVNISYPTTLYEYISEIGTFESEDIDGYRGSIFFVLRENTLINMGIVLDNNSFGTVLEDDERLITHTIEEIQEEYPNTELKVVSIP